MAVSHKPIIWSLFAGGGTFAAFFTPVLIFLTGFPSEALGYDSVIALLTHPLAKGIAFLIVFLPLWHGAHRLRITAYDFGLRSDGLAMLICYGVAALGTLVALIGLIKL
jgi:fumarate reductase subunit D